MPKKQRGSEKQTPTQARSPLAQFLLRAYLDWQRAEGATRSQVEFAAHLGLKVPTLTKLMRGQVDTPSRETIEAIADKCGPWIYDALGLERPDPLLAAVIAGWGGLTVEQQEAIAQSIGITTLGGFVGRPDSRLADVDASQKGGAGASRRVRAPHKT